MSNCEQYTWYCNKREPFATIIRPDRTELLTTSDPAAFAYARLVIKENKLHGYRVITEDGFEYEIASNGKILDCGNARLPGSLFEEITLRLI